MSASQNALINKLLWPFQDLPSNYLVLDTETTGLFDAEGAPGIVTIGIAQVAEGKVIDAHEFLTRPHRAMTSGATNINGISDAEAQSYPAFTAQWPALKQRLDQQLVVCHNATFDWLLMVDHIERYGVQPPSITGVFCSQRAAEPWARATELPCSARGPSLDTLTQAVGCQDLRLAHGGLHGAAIDAKQTAQVVEALRVLAT